MSHIILSLPVLNLTELDVIDTFKTIKIATVYLDPETCGKLPSFPADLNLLSHGRKDWNLS